MYTANIFPFKTDFRAECIDAKKISSLLYCVLKSIIMHLTYLFNNKLRNVVNISFKLKNNDGTPYTLVLTAVFWCRLNSFRFVFCLIVWKSLKWNQKKKCGKRMLSWGLVSKFMHGYRNFTFSILKRVTERWSDRKPTIVSDTSQVIFTFGIVKKLIKVIKYLTGKTSALLKKVIIHRELYLINIYLQEFHVH